MFKTQNIRLFNIVNFVDILHHPNPACVHSKKHSISGQTPAQFKPRIKIDWVDVVFHPNNDNYEEKRR